MKFSSPYTPMLTKSEKNRKKSQIQNFEQKKKWSGDMAKRHVLTKFGNDTSDGCGCGPCDDDDDGQTDDGQQGDLIISASDN